MCGYVGFIEFNCDKHSEYLSATICRMSDRLIHRGPDDFGYWVDRNCGIALGHRRLSIIDTAKTGHQPMHSACGRYVVVYNGEIYNYRIIKRTLSQLDPQIIWRGYSDTEVLLEAISHWGIAAALGAFVGMFSFCLFDRAERKLYLCRDRLGEKPLYYGWLNKTFIFGSELKSFKAHPHWEGQIEPDALAGYLKYGYIQAPLSIYKNIYKLEPGHYLSVDLDRLVNNRSIDEFKHCYWEIDYASLCGKSERQHYDENEYVDELSSLMQESVTNQMISDVPLGAFLSGGIDSSTVVALMQSVSSKPVKTFTIGFDEKEYDESSNARAVACHLGTDHTEFVLTQKDALAVVPELPEIFDEPFSDVSQIPTILLSTVTKRHVTVSLSGDGGDELFAGYNRYFLSNNLWKMLGHIPLSLRKTISHAIKNSPDCILNTVLKGLSGQINRYGRDGSVSHKLKKFTDIMTFTDRENLYNRSISKYQDVNAILTEAYTVGTEEVSGKISALNNYIDYMSCLDQNTYLPDDILVKLDRSSMSVSLESRVPLLDHRIVEFAWRIPQGLKVRNGQGKWILRQVLQRFLPKQMLDHPKRGLGVPMRSWLRKDLRDWSESLLSEKRLNSDGFLRALPIRERWHEHLSGKANWEGTLWNILMFQAWLEHEKNNPGINREDPSQMICSLADRTGT